MDREEFETYLNANSRVVAMDCSQYVRQILREIKNRV